MHFKNVSVGTHTRKHGVNLCQGAATGAKKNQMASFLRLVNICDISAQLRFESDSRSRQSSSTGAAGTPELLWCAQELMGRACVVFARNRGENTEKKTPVLTSSLCLAEWLEVGELTAKGSEEVAFSSTTHTFTHCGCRVDMSVPGHLYSFLACAMSPLLSLVRWPIAGRTPFSSLDGRMVSRNIPL